MRRLLSLALLAAFLLASVSLPSDACAACTTNMIYGPGSKTQLCTTCCDDNGICTTVCF